MFILNLRQIEYLLRHDGTGATLVRAWILEELRETTLHHLVSSRTTIRSLARQLHISERRLGEFLRGALPNAAEWLALARWAAHLPRVAAGAGSLAVGVLTFPAPRRKVYLVRTHLLEAIRDAYENAGCRYPARQLDLW
ncbi:MAG TPA: hypothetical protein VFJ82_20055 [Longimicrobium sp.]|nr:hypothetical protein [Longimicrobium sp.]